MTKRCCLSIWLSFATLIASLTFFSKVTQAANHEIVGSGEVTVTDVGTTTPVDPENPQIDADPGEGPATSGALRIDFVSQLRFGQQQLADNKVEFLSLAQLFYSQTNARGYYVQLSDRREVSSGWELQVSQNKQFFSESRQLENAEELSGATLSFDKGWANSAGDSPAPQITRDTIAMKELQTAYTVAIAEKNQVAGVWVIQFGASNENHNEQPNTLTPLVDERGEAVIDELFNKPAYSNSAIKLTIPKKTEIKPLEYQTSLTWMLVVGPQN
ncbi:WxL domain-containing protein [Enterococcus sp. LJL120]